MNLNPQFTYDRMGNKIGVFLTIDEFEQLTGSSTGEPVEEWERELITQRMAEYRVSPGDGVSWEEVRRQIVEEDGPL